MKRLFFSILAVISTYTMAEGPEIFNVTGSAELPVIDGNLSDWKATEFKTFPVVSAIEGDEQNSVGSSQVELAARVVSDRIYFAARWADDSESMNYRPWVWKATRYRRDKNRDDMLALRFEMSGDYHRSMIAEADYVVDVWAWSSARSNLINSADDLIHRISTTYIENAAEYETDTGKLIFIDRSRDSGELGYDTKKPEDSKVLTENKLPSIEVIGNSTGSVGDVTAKGAWKDGVWSVEFSRLLDTGNPDDRVFVSGDRILFQAAVFDDSYEEHKSVTEPVLLVIP